MVAASLVGAISTEPAPCTTRRDHFDLIQNATAEGTQVGTAQRWLAVPGAPRAREETVGTCNLLRAFLTTWSVLQAALR